MFFRLNAHISEKLLVAKTAEMAIFLLGVQLATEVYLLRNQQSASKKDKMLLTISEISSQFCNTNEARIPLVPFIYIPRILYIFSLLIYLMLTENRPTTGSFHCCNSFDDFYVNCLFTFLLDRTVKRRTFWTSICSTAVESSFQYQSIDS